MCLFLGLSACTARYSAPVEEIGDGPRFLDDGKQHRVNGGETLYAIAWMYDLDVNALARANNLAAPYNVEPGMMLTVDPRVVAGLAPNPNAGNTASLPPVGTAVVTAVPTIGGLQRTPLPSRSLPSNPASDPAPTTTTPPPTSTNTTPPAVAVTPAPPPSTPAQESSVRPLPPSEPVATLPKSDPAPVVAMPANGEIQWDWPHRGNIVGRFSDTSVEGKGLDLAGNVGDPILAAADGEVVYAGGGLQRYGNLLILKHNDHFLSAYAHNRNLLVKEGDKVRRGQKIAELGNSGVDRYMLHFEIRQDGKPVDPLLFLPSR